MNNLLIRTICFLNCILKNYWPKLLKTGCPFNNLVESVSFFLWTSVQEYAVPSCCITFLVSYSSVSSAAYFTVRDPIISWHNTEWVYFSHEERTRLCKEENEKWNYYKAKRCCQSWRRITIFFFFCAVSNVDQ